MSEFSVPSIARQVNPNRPACSPRRLGRLVGTAIFLLAPLSAGCADTAHAPGPGDAQKTEAVSPEILPPPPTPTTGPADDGVDWIVHWEGTYVDGNGNPVEIPFDEILSDQPAPDASCPPTFELWAGMPLNLANCLYYSAVPQPSDPMGGHD